MITITFQGDTWAEVAAQMSAALRPKLIPADDGIALQAVTHPGHERGHTAEESLKTAEERGIPSEEPKAEDEAPKRRGRPPKAAVEEPKAGDDETKGDGALNYEKDVKSHVLDFAAEFGRGGIMGVLSMFNVVNAAQIPVEDLPALLDALKAERAKLSA